MEGDLVVDRVAREVSVGEAVTTYRRMAFLDNLRAFVVILVIVLHGSMYYIHPLILYPLAYVFVPVSLPLFLKALLVITSAVLLSWTVSALVLKKAPLLRDVF